MTLGASVDVARINPEYFWSRVDISTIDACWPWRGNKCPKGYGRVRIGRCGPRYLSHRAAWALIHGDMGELFILHRCDNPSCCNPTHLFKGDNALNMADKVAKGRQSRGPAHSATFRGERHGSAKLTEELVRKIRISVENGVSQSSLARIYKLSIACINDVVHRRRWGHVQ